MLKYKDFILYVVFLSGFGGGGIFHQITDFTSPSKMSRDKISLPSKIKFDLK